MLTKEAPARETPAQKYAVLVVDDEYGPRESVAFTLAAEFAVDTAERATEALAKLKQREYAAIVMDIRMPEMDGIRALEEIRKLDPLISVIMLTGYGTLLTAQQAILGGANQYLRKPPDVAELLEAVRKQTVATGVRRHQAKLAVEALDLNLALKKEIERTEPQVWQGRASVELVHDLNNPLTVVIGYATLLSEEARVVAERDPELGAKLLEYSGMVEKAAEYCHHLSENWRSASKKMLELVRLDLVQIAREVQQVIFFGNVSIVLSGLAEAPILGSKYELMRIFQNLFKNALEAGAKGVQVTFEREGAGIVATLIDDGPGMNAESVRRALQGGYTSKANGTGLGLGICRHLVTAHGGTFDLKSQAGRGTTVRLTFPAASQG
jgi:signal transduction histidine kinase